MPRRALRLPGSVRSRCRAPPRRRSSSWRRAVVHGADQRSQRLGLGPVERDDRQCGHGRHPARSTWPPCSPALIGRRLASARYSTQSVEPLQRERAVTWKKSTASRLVAWVRRDSSCTAGRSSQQRHKSCGEPDAEMIKSHVRSESGLGKTEPGGQPGHRAPGRLQIAGFVLPCVRAGLRESRRAAHPDEGARVRRLSRTCRRSASLRDLSLARSGLAARETGSAVGGR